MAEMADELSANAEDLQQQRANGAATEISFDYFVRLLRRDDARERLLEFVYDTNFRGLYVATRPSALSTASVPSVTPASDHVPITAPRSQVPVLPSLTPSTDPPTTPQPQPAILTQITEVMTQDEAPGSVGKPDEDSDSELEYDEWIEEYVPKRPKVREYELLPLDQAIIVDGGHPNWPAVQKAIKEVEKKRREREEREERVRGPILLETALKEHTGGLKRKQFDSVDEPDDGDSQPPQKKAKDASFTETFDTVRVIDPKGDTEVPSKFPLKPSKTAIGTLDANPSVHTIDKKSPPSVATEASTSAAQALNDTVVADNTTSHAEYVDETPEAEESLLQLSKQDATLHAVPAPPKSPREPNNEVPVSSQASEQEDASSALKQVSTLTPWQPPPEIENLRLSKNINLHPSRQLLAKVTKPRKEPYVFAGKRPSKRKAAQEPDEETRPAKRRNKQPAKDEQDARPASQRSKRKEKVDVQPSRRSTRLNKDISSEREETLAPNAPQSVAPAHEPNLNMAPAAELSSKPASPPRRLVTVTKKEGSRPRLMVKIKINQAKLAKATRLTHP
ncbi:uncharacterized protein N0V89_008376 [Didymosphaeria variabile]|uniref:Uncharacterized protein n=1 Tax=Didymosphaeria variabile TaxID=1932322 RepID=A0A9W8XG36_9PLEO|nr:uncharacterized protein N0V89_008376 [Didymosphaeria variabile]KAJ4349758.1 hypothetical protein N0V89_008376 [Didymosphaeria variabile]